MPEAPLDLDELARPSPGRWILRALYEWTWIVALLVAARQVDRWEGYWLASLLLGARQHALGMLGHDAIHFSISRTKWVNDGVAGVLAFWPMYGGLDGYRPFHMKHHRTTGTGDDPELPFKQWSAPEWSTPVSRWRVLGLFVKDLCGLSAHQCRNLGKLSPPASWADVLGPLGWWVAVDAVLWANGHLWAGWLWLFAFLTSHWAFFRLRIWTEHMGTLGTHRTVAGPVARFFFLQHNIWYHWEHHVHPAVPCWNLPALRAALPGPRPTSFAELMNSLEHAPPWAYGMPPPPARD